MIIPKKGILLIKKYKKSQLRADIVVEESAEDKRLMIGEIISDGDKDYPRGTAVIFGKYALFPITLLGLDYYLLDKNDVVGTTNYRE